MNAKRPSVLVVEDRPGVLKVMAAVLESGYDVMMAADGASALEIVGSAEVDVVLTDIRMPGLSGFEVLREVRERAPRTAVVMMTAYSNVPDAVVAIKLGAYDYVAKPLDADEIALVIARAVEHARGTSEGVEGAAPPPGVQSVQTSDLAGSTLGFRRAVEEARDHASREYLTRLMRLFRGNVTLAAGRAGMTRESLHRVLRKYAIRYEHHDAAHARGASQGEEDGRDPSSGGGFSSKDLDCSK